VNEVTGTTGATPGIAADESEPGPGVYLELGTLPPATVITEDGLAGIMGTAGSRSSAPWAAESCRNQ